MLSDITIRHLLDTGAIGIDPYPVDAAFQPASVDLRLGPGFIRVGVHHNRRIDTHELDTSFILAPGDCVLASTVEMLRLPPTVVARVEGKSSWGRRFLMVHSTAGFIDPGFTGQITLELKNLGPAPIAVPLGAYLAQVSFQYLDRPAARPYGTFEIHSRYQGQTGPTVAKD